VAAGKKELTDMIAEKTGVSKKQASQFIDAFTESVVEQLAAKDRVRLTGFGTFMTRKRVAREGRNPRTGEKINIPAKTVPIFVPGKGLKEKVE